jgi:hypothetical protein
MFTGANSQHSDCRILEVKCQNKEGPTLKIEGGAPSDYLCWLLFPETAFI